MTELRPPLAAPIGKLDPRRTALLVIDLQRYFVHPDHPFGRLIATITPEGSNYYLKRVDELVIPNTQRLLQAFRARGAQVVFTEFGSAFPDGRDMAGWARRGNDLGRETIGSPIYPTFDDDSCRVDDSVAPEPGDLVVQKTTSGPLNSTHLDNTLRVLGIDTVVVVGVVTDVCVAQTTREFGDRDFDAIIVADACAAFDEQRHDATLATIADTFGFVASTDQVLQTL